MSKADFEELILTFFQFERSLPTSTYRLVRGKSLHNWMTKMKALKHGRRVIMVLLGGRGRALQPVGPHTHMGPGRGGFCLGDGKYESGPGAGRVDV